VKSEGQDLNDVDATGNENDADRIVENDDMDATENGNEAEDMESDEAMEFDKNEYDVG
jgi:hypothetical protein